MHRAPRVFNPIRPVVHIFVSGLGHHCFRSWHLSCLALSHYLNLCWRIVRSTLILEKTSLKFQSNYLATRILVSNLNEIQTQCRKNFHSKSDVERLRETERQQRDRQRGGQTDREKERQTGRRTDKHTVRATDRPTDGRTDETRQRQYPSSFPGGRVWSVWICRLPNVGHFV